MFYSETKRSIISNHHKIRGYQSYLTTLDKNWITDRKLGKGSKLIQFCIGDVVIHIPVGSPILNNTDLIKNMRKAFMEVNKHE